MLFLSPRYGQRFLFIDMLIVGLFGWDLLSFFFLSSFFLLESLIPLNFSLSLSFKRRLHRHCHQGHLFACDPGCLANVHLLDFLCYACRPGGNRSVAGEIPPESPAAPRLHGQTPPEFFCSVLFSCLCFNGLPSPQFCFKLPVNRRSSRCSLSCSPSLPSWEEESSMTISPSFPASRFDPAVHAHSPEMD